MKSVPIHLVGSVPFDTADEVFVESVSALGNRLPRIPDGETGDRSQWIMYQYLLLASLKEFTVVSSTINQSQLRAEIAAYIQDPSAVPHLDVSQRQLALRPEISADELQFPPLGYADAAIESYKVFESLKKRGQIGATTRFQVSLPTPLAPMAMFVLPKKYERVWPVYERYKSALLAELLEITTRIPAEELSIQWDVCIEILMLENRAEDADWSSWNNPLRSELCALGAAVADNIHLGFHFCYGDMEHKHFIEPRDTGLMVGLANNLTANTPRPIQWIHMPVPQDRDDVEYFVPLGQLETSPETTIYLGLIHETDGVDGAVNRVAAANEVLANFGIATECGFGRRPRETIHFLLEVHKEVSDRISQNAAT